MTIACLLAVVLTCAPQVDDQSFPTAEPASVGIDPAALERLKVRANRPIPMRSCRQRRQNHRRLDLRQAAGPIEAMSATKSVVNLAIGRLIDQKKIQSIDQPVSDFYPEWKQGRKRLITIRHLLNHTSGIENKPITGEIYASPDFVQFALAAELSDDPGARFAYNNKAVNLLAGIVRKASGQRMDVYIGEEIFKPMGITDFHGRWTRPAIRTGWRDLQIRAIDLAKIGQMMLDGGTWRRLGL